MYTAEVTLRAVVRTRRKGGVVDMYVAFGSFFLVLAYTGLAAPLLHLSRRRIEGVFLEDLFCVSLDRRLPPKEREGKARTVLQATV